MKWLSKAGTAVLIVARFLVTLPYQHLFIYNTLRPAQEIEAVANLDMEVPANRTVLLKAVMTWRTGKLDELTRITVAAVALTAIVTASLSWESVKTSHWTGPACWYASLALCILGFGVASQQQLLLQLLVEGKALDVDNTDAHSAQVVILRHLNQILALKRLTPTPPRSKQHLPTPTDVEAQAGAPTQGQENPSSKAGAVPVATAGDSPPPPQWVLSARRMFVWQCSIMIMAYSSGLYLIGLSIVVCTPILEKRPWDSESYVAVPYIISMGLSGCMVTFISYEAYDYVPEADDADRTFLQKVVRRVRDLSEGRDPFQPRGNRHLEGFRVSS